MKEELLRLAEAPAVIVTQEDREAAAAIVEWQNGTGWEPQFFHPGLPQGMRDGAWDEHPIVLAFASHRASVKEQNNGG
jgi:hypothetical protein